MSTPIPLAFVELLNQSSAPSIGRQMGQPILSLTSSRFKLAFHPDLSVVSAQLREVTGKAVVAQTVLYSTANIRTMCIDPEHEVSEPVPQSEEKRLAQSERMKAWHAERKAAKSTETP